MYRSGQPKDDPLVRCAPRRTPLRLVCVIGADDAGRTKLGLSVFMESDQYSETVLPDLSRIAASAIVWAGKRREHCRAAYCRTGSTQPSTPVAAGLARRTSSGDRRSRRCGFTPWIGCSESLSHG